MDRFEQIEYQIHNLKLYIDNILEKINILYEMVDDLQKLIFDNNGNGTVNL